MQLAPEEGDAWHSFNHIEEQAAFIPVTSSGGHKALSSLLSFRGTQILIGGILFQVAPVSFNSEDTSPFLLCGFYFLIFFKEILTTFCCGK